LSAPLARLRPSRTEGAVHRPPRCRPAAQRVPGGADARFDDARLLRCDLSGAWLHSASFTGCALRGSDLSAFDPETTEPKGAVIDPAQALVIAAALGLVVRED
jgi:hypothetical protein